MVEEGHRSGRSSSGRTTDSDSVNLGSNPSLPARNIAAILLRLHILSDLRAQSAVIERITVVLRGSTPGGAKKLHLFYFAFAKMPQADEEGCHASNVAGVLQKNCFALGLFIGFRNRFAWAAALCYSGFRGNVDAKKGASVFCLWNREQATCFPLTKIPEYCFNAPLYAGPDPRSGKCLPQLSSLEILS